MSEEEGVWEEDDTEYVDVFVYGTLMRGYGNNFFLRHDVYLGPGETQPEYTLYDLRHFPAMVEGGDTSVKGEIYEVHPKTIEWLDKLEGVAEGLYKREEIILADGEKALTYIFPRSNLEQRDVPIKNGDWREWVSSRKK
jgi:gamma-glutamylcyclotransferase (GGCT)/AIG2-like uncharacterized protein YtfP